MKRLIALLILAAAFAVPSNSQQSTITLFYVATAVDSNGAESGFSNEVSGVLSVQHPTSDLTWIASTSAVAGYNIYRGKVSGGPYVKLNTSLILTLSYQDTYTFPAPPSTLKITVP